MSEFEPIASEIKLELEKRHLVREEVLKKSRILIQTCSKAIKLIHRRDFDAASAMIAEARGYSTEMRNAAAGHPEVLYAGYIQDSEKEMVEAAGLLALVSGQHYPTPETMGVGLTSYLNGMGEAASEVRRYVLDDMRAGKFAQAEAMMARMESVYDELTTFDFPDSVTGGLRRTCDALRAVIERTRSDLTLTALQQELVQELRKHEK